MANWSGQGIDIPMTACGDLNAVQYRFVEAASAAGRVEQSTGGSAPYPLGILQNDPASLDGANVRIAGTSILKVNADTAILYGDFLTSNSVGMGIKTTTASIIYHAIALEEVASGSNIEIKVLVKHGPVW